MTRDLLEENQDLRKQIAELKDQIATMKGKLAILISDNERLKTIILGNEEEISALNKSCDKIQKLLDKENAELKEKLKHENCLKLLAKEGYISWSLAD